MSYQLGIDLGTTFTAAAVCRAGRGGSVAAEPVTLGAAAATVPSVLYLGADGSIVVGEAAERRALTEPDRVVREFKRRIGDDTPYMLGGREYRAHELAALLVRWVTDRASERTGGPPAGISVTHPATWGRHKQELLAQALERIGRRVTLLAEPQAAALSYASAERVAPGSTIAVYDLGGGTFDAAVVRKNGTFTLLGDPEGIERLGGLDFDDLILGAIKQKIGEELWDALDPADPAVINAVAQLRRECVEAKIALSTDTEVTIPVLLPELRGKVKLTRGQFEGMLRGPLDSTIAALRQTIRSAGLTAADLSAVLLVGGSSRIPLVAELVTRDLERPVALDADPQLAIATGAAISSLAVDRVTAEQPVTPDPGTGATPSAPAPPQATRHGSKAWPTAAAHDPPSGPMPVSALAAAALTSPSAPIVAGSQSDRIPVQPTGAPSRPSPPTGSPPSPRSRTAPVGPSAPLSGAIRTPGPSMPSGRGRPAASAKPPRRYGRVILLVGVLAVVLAAAAVGGHSLLQSRGVVGSGGSSASTGTPLLVAAIKVGGVPNGVAVTPDGRRLYATDRRSSRVSVIDTATNAVIATIGLAGPEGVVISPDGARAYVTTPGSNAVSVLDTATNSLTNVIRVGRGPDRIALNSAGTRAYVTNNGAGSLSVVDTTTGVVVETVRVSNGPAHPIISPDQRWLYVTHPEFDTISIVDTTTNKLVNSLKSPGAPLTISFSPDGERAYLTNNVAGTVSVMDTATNAVRATIPVGTRPARVVTTADGRALFVTLVEDHAVAVIDTATNAIRTTLSVDANPSDAILSPDSKHVYLTSFGAGTVSVLNTGL